MRCLFLEPTAGIFGPSSYGSCNMLEPLGLEYLASYLGSNGHFCQVIQQRKKDKYDVLQEIVSYVPDVLGISTQTYNINEALWFAEQAKKFIPGVTVVFGGYHATAVPQIATSSQVDFVVMGEGEVVISELLDALENGGAIDNIKGLAYFDKELRVHRNHTRISNLDGLSFPSRKLGSLCQYNMYGLMYPPPSKQVAVAAVTATRGCPYNCTFCCSRTVWGEGVTRRSPINVADELEMLVEKHQINGVFFCDLTFNASKKYSISLCEEIARRNLSIYFYAMCNLRGMDKDIVEAMAAAKCTKIGFGIESFNKSVQANMKSGRGIDLETTNSILDIVSSAGIFSKGYFIIGFPWETRKDMTHFEDDIKRVYLDDIRITFYVPFPGTKGYELHSSCLITNDWSKFDTLTEPVVKNDNIGTQELIEFRKKIYEVFFNDYVWLERMINLQIRFPRYRESIKEFISYLKERGILIRNENHFLMAMSNV